MKSLLNDVAKFHRATGMPVVDVPWLPSPERASLRIALIVEEVLNELLPALRKRDMPQIADALADSIYVLVGTALEYGIPLDRVWDEVQRSNMTKVDPVTGKVEKRADGKILKPPGFRPPDIKKILNIP